MLDVTGMVTGLGTTISAEQALGTWQTQADKKGQIAHVKVTRCDEALCGDIVRTYDSEGKPHHDRKCRKARLLERDANR